MSSKHAHTHTHTHTVFHSRLDRDTLRQEAGRQIQLQTKLRLTVPVLPPRLQSGAAVHAQSGGAWCDWYDFVRVCVQEPVYRGFVKMLGEKVMLAINAQLLPHVALPARLFTKFSLCSLL